MAADSTSGTAIGALYVWDPQIALKLRKSRRIMGSLVGTKVGQEMQNGSLSLPLELSFCEADLVSRRGWFEQAEPSTDPAEINLDDAAGEDASPSNQDAGGATDWRTAAVGELDFVLPQQTAPPAASAVPGITQWSDEVDDQQLAKHARLTAVFNDLRRRGFHVTGGRKFGGHFLAYQGDPCLFHAQYCIRVQEAGAPYSIVMMAAAHRGAHGAKKELLLAQVSQPAEGEEQQGLQVVYYRVLTKGTLGPVFDLVHTTDTSQSKLSKAE